MASTQSKSAKASATRSDGESARWIFGLLLLFAGIFLVASVVFYYFDWRGDYSALHGIGSENPNFDDSIDNPCGRLGAWTAEMLVGRSFECLFDRHSGNEVQVDVFGDIQNCLLYKERRIKCNKQMAGETKCFRVERNKPQIHTFLSVHI